MTRPLVTIHNLESYEIIQREMNDSEFANYQKLEEINSAKQAEAEAKETQRQALLTRLGITADEAQLLLGGN